MVGFSLPAHFEAQSLPNLLMSLTREKKDTIKLTFPSRRLRHSPSSRCRPLAQSHHPRPRHPELHLRRGLHRRPRRRRRKSGPARRHALPALPLRRAEPASPEPHHRVPGLIRHDHDREVPGAQAGPPHLRRHRRAHLRPRQERLPARQEGRRHRRARRSLQGRQR